MLLININMSSVNNNFHNNKVELNSTDNIESKINQSSLHPLFLKVSQVIDSGQKGIKGIAATFIEKKKSEASNILNTIADLSMGNSKNKSSIFSKKMLKFVTKNLSQDITGSVINTISMHRKGYFKSILADSKYKDIIIDILESLNKVKQNKINNNQLKLGLLVVVYIRKQIAKTQIDELKKIASSQAKVSISKALSKTSEVYSRCKVTKSENKNITAKEVYEQLRTTSNKKYRSDIPSYSTINNFMSVKLKNMCKIFNMVQVKFKSNLTIIRKIKEEIPEILENDLLYGIHEKFKNIPNDIDPEEFKVCVDEFLKVKALELSGIKSSGIVRGFNKRISLIEPQISDKTKMFFNLSIRETIQDNIKNISSELNELSNSENIIESINSGEKTPAKLTAFIAYNKLGVVMNKNVLEERKKDLSKFLCPVIGVEYKSLSQSEKDKLDLASSSMLKLAESSINKTIYPSISEEEIASEKVKVVKTELKNDSSDKIDSEKTQLEKDIEDINKLDISLDITPEETVKEGVDVAKSFFKSTKEIFKDLLKDVDLISIGNMTVDSSIKAMYLVCMSIALKFKRQIIYWGSKLLYNIFIKVVKNIYNDKSIFYKKIGKAFGLDKYVKELTDSINKQINKDHNINKSIEINTDSIEGSLQELSRLDKAYLNSKSDNMLSKVFKGMSEIKILSKNKKSMLSKTADIARGMPISSLILIS